MADRPDKQSRKAALTAWKAEQRSATRAGFPLPPDQLSALFDALDTQLPRRGCDHSFRLVREWCNAAGVEATLVESWMRDNGGYCDCEALANTEQVFQETIREPGA